MNKTRNFVLIGGPYGGVSGEFLDTGQMTEGWGPESGRNFFYKRSVKAGRDGAVRFVFSRELTTLALRAAGVPEDLIAEAARGDLAASIVRQAHTDEDGLHRKEVKVVLLKDTYAMMVDDEIIDSVSKDRIESRDQMKDWVASVMLPDYQKEAAHASS